MVRTRLIVGTILAVLAAGMLWFDERFAPWFPFLLLTVTLLSAGGTWELLRLLPEPRRPSRALCMAGAMLLIALNWAPVIKGTDLKGHLFLHTPASDWVIQGFAAVILLAFLTEMATFRVPGRSVERLALAVWIVAYLGVLPGFLVRLRIGEGASLDAEAVSRGSIALALAIFVPKGCDIGAYFTGRLLGRHRMTPVLSPKKTWEGAAGGLAAAVGVAFALDQYGPVIPGGPAGTVAFGLTVGLAGMLGDLAESLIKRDCERKDASQVVPGFGGILDVVDAIIFAAPVAYWWLH
jgi:phosphatidate cytidylyltransferase